MNESIRTLVFVVVGVVAALGAFVTRPAIQQRDVNLDDSIPDGEPLFPNFKDPLLAKSLEIKQFDEATARAASFVVSQQPSGRWTIPSHGGYPADAASQLKAVAETLSDLKVIGKASDKSVEDKNKEQELYGVKDPEKAETLSDLKCIGVASDQSVEDKNKEQELYGVKDPEKAEVGTAGVGTLIAIQDGKGNDLLRMVVGKEVAGAANQRFVRKPGEDVVYVTTVDLTKLPTEFDKWIEKDLLKLSTFDVAKVTLKDYLLLQTSSGGLTPFHRMDATLNYDSGKGEWKLEEDMTVYRDGRQAMKSPLGDMEELNKQKLDDLRNALGDLKIVDVAKKPEGLGNSLRVSSDKLPRDQRIALQEYGFFPHAAADGSLDIYGKNGEVLIDTKDGVQYILRFGDIAPQTAVSTAPKKPAKGKAAEEEQVKVHRYLFVTTQLAPSILKQPELEPEPAGPEAKDEKKSEGEKKEGEAAKAGDQKSDEEKAAVVDPQQAERERIKKENERKLNAYKDQRKKAELKVGELNARFADWYYVVSEDVYKKIRLVRSDIVKESATAKDEGFGIDAFRKLEEEGLKGAAKPATP